MDQQSATVAGLTDVEADRVYLAPMKERPHSYIYDPPPGVPRTNTVNQSQLVTMHDARPIAADPSLDREGFELVEHRTAVHDFYDDDELRRVYDPEAERRRPGAIYLIQHNPKQRWYYVPAMREDEALLLKCYDLTRDGGAVLSPHGAFEDATAPADVLPRESIELRTIAFHAS